MRRFKQIKNLTKSDIDNLCNRQESCNTCILRKVCCLTADLYTFIQEYKKSGTIDYEMERSIYIWSD